VDQCGFPGSPLAYVADGICDDGGPAPDGTSSQQYCLKGMDCTDCGVRGAPAAVSLTSVQPVCYDACPNGGTKIMDAIWGERDERVNTH
jgi:hypothetical protein